MKAVLIFITVMILIGMGIHSLFFSNSSAPKRMPKRVVVETPEVTNQPSFSMEERKEEGIVREERFREDTLMENPIAENIKLSNQDNKYKEVNALFKKAKDLFSKSSKDAEALELYSEIIDKIGDSSDVKLLKLLAKAYFGKATLHGMYPNNDKESAMEAYNVIIEKFENSNNPELLELYIDARLGLSYQLSNEDQLEIYEELSQKFAKHESKIIQDKLDNILNQQGNILMRENNEEALQIFDKLLDKHIQSGASKLPTAMEYAIINNIELAMTTNNDDEKYHELAKKYLIDSPDSKPLIAMLDILKESQYMSQDDALQSWIEENKDYNLGGWSFLEVKRWVKGMEDEEVKARVSSYIKQFENHRYSSYGNYTTPVNTTTLSKDGVEIPTVYEHDTSGVIYSDPYAVPVESGSPIEYAEPIEPLSSDDIYSQPTYENPYSEEKMEEAALQHSIEEYDSPNSYSNAEHIEEEEGNQSLY